MAKITREDALEYHHLKGKPGKIAIVPTKPMDTQRDLSLAYSPGVAEPVLEIEKDPELAYEYTSKGNLVAVISNGTAILGLGDRGALAAKPVMEGKGVLFKKFADVDVFDIEVDTHDPDEVIRVARAIAPTFGGINLEDIKAPECFYIEEELKKMLDIPVFHDDQHGTAIISAAGLASALEVVGKKHSDIRITISGAGASAISCAELAIRWGVKRENIMLVDSKGVVYKGRTEGMNKYKERFIVETDARTLADAVRGSDVFYGLSVANVLTPEMVKSMAPDPIVFAMANPDPEIRPELAREARKDVIIATGRSDYVNQVNNVLGFPFIFRGALDVRARAINDDMKFAASKALAALTHCAPAVHHTPTVPVSHTPAPAPPLAGRIWEVAHGRFIDEATLVHEALTAHFVLLGEVHDSPEAHAHQASLVQSLAGGGRHPAVVFEMIDADQQPLIDHEFLLTTIFMYTCTHL
jgi:malate dehydrogenase (oxaloacetate-decarboxylating)(NADP+)